jgi:hypothetical protein
MKIGQWDQYLGKRVAQTKIKRDKLRKSCKKICDKLMDKKSKG